MSEQAPWLPSKCRVPMWSAGGPAGFCDAPTFGPQLPMLLLYQTRGWSRTRIPYCFGPCCPQHGGPDAGAPILFEDGTTQQGLPMWCAVMPGFINLQESIAAFAADPLSAIAELMAKTREATGAAIPHGFVHTTPDPDACDHEWRGWREFEDGRGGEQVCAKCGLGAMAHTLRVGP